MYIKLYRDADPGGGGGNVPPSLEDLDNPQKTPPVVTDPPAPPAEGLDADGNLLEGYERLEDGTVQKIQQPPKEEEEEEEEEDKADPVVEDFWAEVNKVTGREVQVDYGDVDPLSIEGAAIRERAVREDEAFAMDQHLRETYPRAYAYFLHVKEGGADEDFFTVPSPGIPERQEFLEDPDMQASLVIRSLTSKGVPESVAQSTVDMYIKENKLQEHAVKLYDSVVEEDKLRLAQIEKKAKEQQEEFRKNVESLSSSIQNSINTQMKLVVPDAQRAEFGKFVMDHIQHDGNQFFFVTPIDQDINSTLDALFVKYKKGNLKDLIEREAKTKAVQRLGQRVARDKQNAKGQGGDEGGSKYVTLAEI